MKLGKTGIPSFKPLFEFCSPLSSLQTSILLFLNRSICHWHGVFYKPYKDSENKITSTSSIRYKLWGNAFNPAELEMARLIYIFYVSKIYEFLDTFFMIAKENIEQV